MTTKTHTFFRAALAAILLVTLAALPAAAQELWFHVEVDERTGENAQIHVNLPVSMIQSMMPMISEQAALHGGTEIDIDGSDVTVSDLREIVASLRDAPDATFAEITTDSESIVFYKSGDYLRVETDADAGGTEITARFPITVLDALLSGPGETLDFEGAVMALANHGPGDLVTVRDGETRIRVWIDEYPEAR